jgi:hypothetical protein
VAEAARVVIMTTQYQDDINIGGGYGYVDPIVQYLVNWLMQQMAAGQAAGYVPGGYLGLEWLLPTLGREEFRSGTIFNLAELMGNPRDWGQLKDVYSLSGTASPISSAVSQGMPFVGEDWTALIDNLAAMIPQGTQSATSQQAPWYESDPYYSHLTPEGQTLVRGFTPEQQENWKRFMAMTPEQQRYVAGGG